MPGTPSSCWTVTTNNTTVFGGDGTPVSLADFKVGDTVVVCYSVQGGAVVAASITRIAPAPPPPPSATPELDSLFLFGGGLSSLGVYALRRLRAQHRT